MDHSRDFNSKFGSIIRKTAARNTLLTPPGSAKWSIIYLQLLHMHWVQLFMLQVPLNESG